VTVRNDSNRLRPYMSCPGHVIDSDFEPAWGESRVTSEPARGAGETHCSHAAKPSKKAMHRCCESFHRRVWPRPNPRSVADRPIHSHAGSGESDVHSRVERRCRSGMSFAAGCARWRGPIENLNRTGGVKAVAPTMPRLWLIGPWARPQRSVRPLRSSHRAGHRLVGRSPCRIRLQQASIGVS
jgi:hypothetical protein